jgi:hypothetical protein
LGDGGSAVIIDGDGDDNDGDNGDDGDTDPDQQQADELFNSYNPDNK